MNYKSRAVLLIGLALIFLTYFSSKTFASSNIDCANRYVTLVNPVRSRDLWFDKSLSPIINQYSVIKKNNLSATWLLQYDTLFDKDLINEVSGFDSNQERGVFLEISKRLTDESGVIYPVDTPWFKPNAVFLSGYSQSDRKKLIDKFFTEFKNKFGFFPSSVGAWWIDSYSLNYLKEKYKIKSAMIVADQKSTDNYGVWGQWWGMPYYPSKANILTPASSLENKQDVVVTQWAQRDPIQAYGNGPKVSNYSLQANDYIRQGKDINYFKDISSTYLDCVNPLGQITVGLETGQESIDYLGEYSNQLDYIKNSKIMSLTMTEFSNKFELVYPTFPNRNILISQNSIWSMSPTGRINQSLREQIVYNPEQTFSDYFLADHSEFLNRDLSSVGKLNVTKFIPWYLLFILISGIIFFIKKRFQVFICGVLFSFLSFGLILISNFQYGFKVFYGTVVSNLIISQVILVAVSFLICLSFDFLKKKKDLSLFLLPLAFFIDPITKSLRYSHFGGKYYFGLATDVFRFSGLSFSKLSDLSVINREFPSSVASAFLKIDFNKIWNSPIYSLIFYPLGHILLALALFLVIKKIPFKFRVFILALIVVLTANQLGSILTSDPRVAEPIF